MKEKYDVPIAPESEFVSYMMEQMSQFGLLCTEEQAKDDDSNFHFKHMNADSDIADLDIEDLSVDIDEDLSEGVSDLYAMDGVSEEDTAVDTKPLHEDDVNPEKTKEEDSVNSSIHL